jgi:hypothetical protein
MFDPEAAARTAIHSAPPGGLVGGEPSAHALQILTTEHWSLLGSRSLGYTESLARAALFVAALSGAVVALALVAQATDFGDGFVAFALVLLPVVYFLGVVTVVRIGQINSEDAIWVQGMNRLRHAYLEIAPELEPYFITSRYDDMHGVVSSIMPRRRLRPQVQAFVALPGLIAVVDSVVAGAATGIAGLSLDLGTAAALALGALAFVLSLIGFVIWGVRGIGRGRAALEPRFPTPHTR